MGIFGGVIIVRPGCASASKKTALRDVADEIKAAVRLPFLWQVNVPFSRQART